MYHIEGLYEKGGMSLLYIGTHPQTHETALVKVLSPKYLSNQEVVLRFLNEAKIISLTDHPNIVKLSTRKTSEGALRVVFGGGAILRLEGQYSL